MRKTAVKMGAIWLVVLMVASVFLVVIPSNASADFEGGSGTLADPYQIADVNQLQEMNTDLSAHYILVDDIDASDTENWNEGAGFMPIGTEFDMFTGTLNGNMYEITDLYINRPTTRCVGTIGMIDELSVIKNVGIVNADITGLTYVGGLLGVNFEGTISNCYASGDIKSTNMYCGGLLGFNHEGLVSNSYATSTVTGNQYVGGFIGGSRLHLISNCYASGSVIGYDGVGGFVGLNMNYGIISGSYSTGSVSGTISVGGFAGVNNYYAIISNSYTTGSVSGTLNVGGFAGKLFDHATISNSYSTGSVSGKYRFGGFIGYQYYWPTITISFWDIDTSGQTRNGGGTGKTTEQMMQQATFVEWDFINVWEMKEDITYPFLQWESQVHQTQDLTSDIEELELPDGLESSLVSKLDGAISALEKDQDTAAINKLDAFINQVDAQRGKKITEDQADELVATAKWIIGNI